MAWATGYNVYRGTVPGGELVTPLNAILLTGTSYDDKSVAGQTAYYYVVRPVDATGIGAASAKASATTPGPEYNFAHDQDIVAPLQAGSLAYASGTYTVKGGGTDIWAPPTVSTSITVP